jgi:vacuolar-type H+-ATPase subunit E/Vma4
MIGECVVAPSRDVDRQIAKEIGVMATREKINALGGVIVRTKDGNREIDNTFDGILDRRMEEIRIKVAKKLFK